MASEAVKEAVENLRQAMLDDDMDEGTVNAKLAAVIPNETNLVGNFADLNRLGALVADEGTANTSAVEQAVVIPPTTTVDGEPATGASTGGGDLSGMTKADLQALADERGVDYNSGDTKADLIAKLGG
jgi:hypothetical protein